MAAKKKNNTIKKKTVIEKDSSKDVPLHMRDDLVFEKACPNCKATNYTTEVKDRGEGWARIWFHCKQCKKDYSNWWYGTSPEHGNEPQWYKILRKSFKAMCLKKARGLTLESTYEAFESLDNPDMLTIIKNDDQQQQDYPKEIFITNRQKSEKI